MIQRVLFSCLIFSLLCGLVPAIAGEMVDNPMYQHWAKFKVGSFSTLKSTMSTGGETEMTQTLKELTPQKAVVEMKNVMVMAGKKTEIPPQLITHPAKIEKGKASDTHMPAGSAKVASGEETITVKSKGITCKWVKSEISQNSMKTTTTAWINDDIPGTLVKSDSKTEGTVKMSTLQVLIDFKADKK
jgi:hypothetical protein